MYKRQVRYYTTNPQGQIDKLILNDVTGDLWYYGVLDDVKNVAANYSTLDVYKRQAKASPRQGRWLRQRHRRRG